MKKKIVGMLLWDWFCIIQFPWTWWESRR